VRPKNPLAATIPLPPLDEQRRIVARIEALATRIEQARGLRRKAMAEADRLLIAMAHRDDLEVDGKRRAGWREVEVGQIVSLEQLSSSLSRQGVTR
jgi:hypothetical protein